MSTDLSANNPSDIAERVGDLLRSASVKLKRRGTGLKFRIVKPTSSYVLPVRPLANGDYGYVNATKRSQIPRKFAWNMRTHGLQEPFSNKQGLYLVKALLQRPKDATATQADVFTPLWLTPVLFTDQKTFRPRGDAYFNPVAVEIAATHDAFLTPAGALAQNSRPELLTIDPSIQLIVVNVDTQDDIDAILNPVRNPIARTSPALFALAGRPLDQPRWTATVPAHLDVDQRAAFVAVAGGRHAQSFGPPGYGKSALIVQLALAATTAGKTVLISRRPRTSRREALFVIRSTNPSNQSNRKFTAPTSANASSQGRTPSPSTK